MNLSFQRTSLCYLFIMISAILKISVCNSTNTQKLSSGGLTPVLIVPAIYLLNLTLIFIAKRRGWFEIPKRCMVILLVALFPIIPIVVIICISKKLDSSKVGNSILTNYLKSSWESKEKLADNDIKDHNANSIDRIESKSTSAINQEFHEQTIQTSHDSVVDYNIELVKLEKRVNAIQQITYHSCIPEYQPGEEPIEV